MSYRHDHAFLSSSHAESERAVGTVIALTTAMMALEIGGGWLFGSMALIADGVHMSTHAGALLLAALAYRLARQRVNDPAYTFGAGKFGDLAGYSSALILAVIALGIGYEAAMRLIAPVRIAFTEAIPIAALGLVVNVVSAWLLSRGGALHAHHHHGRDHEPDETRLVAVAGRRFRLEIFDNGVAPRFRLTPPPPPGPSIGEISIETVRPGGARRRFRMIDEGGYFQSADEIPEPHAFEAIVRIGDAAASCRFDEIEAHASVGHDHNMRAALLHVVADAAVSVMAIAGLTLAMLFGWAWMDPLAGLVGAVVISSWSYQLIRDTARVLLDMNPDPELSKALSEALQRQGDALADLHVWRLGPGHLGAILSIETESDRNADHYRAVAQSLGRFSHLTVEVARRSRGDGEPLRAA